MIAGFMDLSVSLSKINRGTVKQNDHEMGPHEPNRDDTLPEFRCGLGLHFGKVWGQTAAPGAPKRPKILLLLPSDYMSTAIASPVDSSKFHEP